MKTSKLFVLLVAFMIAGVSANSQSNSKISKKLSDRIQATENSEVASVWIFFKDKGSQIDGKLQSVEETLPANSIKRRKKTFKSNSNLATFYDIPVNQEYIDLVSPYISNLRQTSRWLNAVSAEISTNNINILASMPFIKKLDIVHKGSYANQNKGVSLSSVKSMDSGSSKYTLDYGSSLTQNQQINVPTVHDMGYSGDGVVICVMDAGFNNLEHQAFGSMDILGAWDFVNDDNNVDDEGDMGTGDHGTMTLSTIGGFYEGQLIGPAYGASYVLAKTENNESETQIEEDHWVAAMEWAELNYGPDITSTSLGYIEFDDGSWYSASELDGNTAVITIGADIAASLGILVVNSAGNEGPGTTTIGAPADGDSVLAVGAVYDDGTITSFSSMGPTGDGRTKPEVMAMGAGVVVAEVYGNYYSTANGTSFSCPLTAGAAALLVEMMPDASNMEIFEALKETANNASSPNNQYGWGIIDVYEAYNHLQVNPNPTITHDVLVDVNDLNGPYLVSATIESNLPFISGSPELYYRIDAGDWVAVSMNDIAKGTFEAEIPGTGTPAIYDYYIKAENSESVVTLPEDAPSNHYTFETSADGIVQIGKNDWGKLTPNPANQLVNVKLIKGLQSNIALYNAVGQKVIEESTTQGTYSINTSNLEGGVYFCKVQVGNNVTTKKLIVKH